MSSSTESEVKLRYADPAEARAAVARLGARLGRPRHLEDNVLFDDAGAGLANAGKVLRLRRTDGAAVLTYKGPRRIVDGVKAREELEAAVPDADALEGILFAVGFRPVFRYQKYRETYELGDVEIVVDETPVGTFLELEGAIDGIHAAARALGRGPQDYVTDSYAGLYRAAGGTGDMVFE